MQDMREAQLASALDEVEMLLLQVEHYRSRARATDVAIARFEQALADVAAHGDTRSAHIATQALGKARNPAA